MTLSFTQTINGKPNYFIEKIWQGILKDNFRLQIEYGYLAGNHNYKFGKFWDGFLADDRPLSVPKLHTIREDKSNRWRTGTDIHFVINNRTKNRFQFAPVIKCVSTQDIEIRDVTGTKVSLANSLNFGWIVSHQVKDVTFYLAYEIYIDGKRLLSDEISKLAINDGFDSVDDFFAYFNKDFTGKLIHWTNLKY